jgi:hypothetical protein
MKKALTWSRGVGDNVTVPLTFGIFNENSSLSDWMLANSDVISFHSYSGLSDISQQLLHMQSHGRPVVCSEYMARRYNSTFDPILGFLKDQEVWAFNCGFVNGRTQTIYPWDSWNKQYNEEPSLWHHDVVWSDGTPFLESEAHYIVNLKARSSLSSSAEHNINGERLYNSRGSIGVYDSQYSFLYILCPLILCIAHLANHGRWQ